MTDTLRLKKAHDVVVGFEVVGENSCKIMGGYSDVFKPHQKNISSFPPVQSAFDTIVDYYKTNNLSLVVHSGVRAYLRDQIATKIYSQLQSNLGIFDYFNTPNLYQHQRSALNMALDNYHFNGGKLRLLLADDPRLGKSAQALAALATIGIKGNVLILCPKSLAQQWVQYVKDWAGDYECLVLLGTTKQKRQAWLNYNFSDKPVFVITNWESLRGLTELFNHEWFALVGDEAHKLKNRHSQVVAAVKRIVARHILLLSATFVENLPDQWYAPLSIIDPEHFSSFWRFAGFYCELENGYGVELVKPKNTGWLREHLATYVIQRKSDDIANLPKKLVETVPCALDKDHIRFYDKLVVSIRVELSENTTISVFNVVSLMTRLRQACIHPLMLDPTNNLELETGKLDTLKELVLNRIPNDEQVIVYSNFRKGCEFAFAALSSDTPSFIYTGAQTEVTDFQQGKHRVMITTPQKGGVGLNLFNADWIVYLDMPWSTIDIRQSEERVRAIGKQKPVTILRLVAHNTIDDYILEHVLNKLNNVSESEIIEKAVSYMNELS